MHIHKTGELIRAAVLLGAGCGSGLEPEHSARLDRFAKAAGLAFQVVDDLLDAQGDTATLGKTAGKDARQNKPTYVSVLGVSRAREFAHELRSEALARARAVRQRGRPAARADRFHRPAQPLMQRSVQMYELLTTINDPADLRKLDRKQLPRLAEELRTFLLESVSRTGGHLSSNLGTVELTVALHYVFDTPRDRLVWDVGHQTYAHKILTGRREAMAGLAHLGRHCRISAPRGEPLRHLRHRSLQHLDQRRAGHGRGRTAGRGRPARGRGHRRRRSHRGDGLRGAEQRRGHGRQSAGDPQRQRHVDLGERRCAEQLPGAADVGALLRGRAPRRRAHARRRSRRCWTSPAAPRST